MPIDPIKPPNDAVRPNAPDFAERVLEGAPVFAAILAKAMADEAAKAPQAEDREKAHELEELARENTEKTRRVLPAENI
ncbi:MAG: hypothetical protein WC582_03080 [Patescibacteria group bacterium]|jgi:hypothetical protein